MYSRKKTSGPATTKPENKKGQSPLLWEPAPGGIEFGLGGGRWSRDTLWPGTAAFCPVALERDNCSGQFDALSGRHLGHGIPVTGHPIS